jgi:hypothetical protein
MDMNSHTMNGSGDPHGTPVYRSYSGEPSHTYRVVETPNGRVATDGDNTVNPDVSIWMSRVEELASRDPKLRERYRGAISYAAKLSFEAGPQVAMDHLKETYVEIAEYFEAERNARLAFLGGSMLVAGIAEFLCLRWYMTLPAANAMHSVMAGLAAASLGGFMSVATAPQGRNGEMQEGALINGLYGSLRSVFALIAGFMTFMMIRTGMGLTFLQHEDAFGGLLLACFLAGYCERHIFRSLGGGDRDHARKEALPAR